jgi:hypothetical protein
MPNKKTMIYTVTRTGSNFLAQAFFVFCPTVILTHNKDRLGTDGKEIDYKEYDVFVSLRKPKDTLLSNLYADNPISEEQIEYAINKLINKNIEYFNIVLRNPEFYIMKFEDFTTDTKNVFLKLQKDKNYDVSVKRTINNYPFYNHPLETILENKDTDPIRYPRIKDKAKLEKFENIVNSESVKSQLVDLEKLYDQVLERYNSQ